MSESFERKVRVWEKSIEDIVMGMNVTTRSDGIKVHFDDTAMIKEFNTVVAGLRSGLESKDTIIITPEGAHYNGE